MIRFHTHQRRRIGLEGEFNISRENVGPELSNGQQRDSHKKTDGKTAALSKFQPMQVVQFKLMFRFQKRQ